MKEAGKYVIIFLITLLTANNLLADDNQVQKPPKDSTEYSKFNIHAGVGVLNGTRLGVNYRFNRNFSINIDYGVSTHIFYGYFHGIFGGPTIVYNTDLNYHFKNMSSPIINISVAYSKWNKPKNYSFVLSPNIGYVFNIPVRIPNQ